MKISSDLLTYLYGYDWFEADEMTAIEFGKLVFNLNNHMKSDFDDDWSEADDINYDRENLRSEILTLLNGTITITD